jgi:hypothetical protein
MTVPSWVQNVNLAATPRKHLQDIAKMHGIKANVKTGMNCPAILARNSPHSHFPAEIVEQLEAIKSTLLNQRAPAAASTKPSRPPSHHKPASPLLSPGRCAASPRDARSPRIPQLNFGSGSKQARFAHHNRPSVLKPTQFMWQMSDGSAARGRKRDRDSIDSVSSDVLRQVSASDPGLLLLRSAA